MLLPVHCVMIPTFLKMHHKNQALYCHMVSNSPSPHGALFCVVIWKYGGKLVSGGHRCRLIFPWVITDSFYSKRFFIPKIYIPNSPSGSEIWRESGSPFSQRFSSTKLLESKWILVNVSFYHTKLYCENPWIVAKFHWEIPNGFLHSVANL